MTSLYILLGLFANNLLPILLIAGAGYLVGTLLELETRSIALLTFNVFGPCLVFRVITSSGLGGGAMASMIAVAVFVSVIMAAAAWLAGRALGLPRKLRAALVLVAMLHNTGNYGLSLSKLAFGEAALAHAGIYFVTTSVIMYTGGVLVASLGTASLGTALRGLLRVPSIYAVALAVLVLHQGWQLPLPLERTVSLAGEAAIPSFLAVLGMQLRRAHSIRPTAPLAVTAGLRLVGSPLAALLMVAVLGLDGAARQAALVEAAMPAAVSSTVLAEAYDAEPGFVTTAVLVTTLVSPITLTPLLAWLGAG